MERNLEGQHTAATRERFMMCVNSFVARRDALPESMLVADPDLPAFTWLPLTTLQAAIFKREGVVNNPEYFANSVAKSQDADQEGYPIAFPDGVPSRIRYKVQTDDRGQNLGMQTEFRISGRWHMKDPTDRIQLGQKGSPSISDLGRTRVLAMEEALHAGAAAHHGQMSAAIAALALASGSGSFDAAGNLMVTAEHVQERPADSDSDPECIAKPVHGFGSFAAPAATQPCPALHTDEASVPVAEAAVEEPDHQPVPVPLAETEPEDERAEDVSEAALTFDQLLPEEQFFQRGLGEGDAMIFDDGKFKDQALLRKVLLSGQSELKLSRVVDLYHHVDSTDAKRRKVRPRLAQVKEVWGAASRRFPRLGCCRPCASNATDRMTWNMVLSRIVKVRQQLAAAWAREILWRRAGEAGDREDMLALDGNAKLRRRTCGMPFAELVESTRVDKFLLRGCSCKPHGRDERATDREQKAEVLGRYATWTSSAEDLSGFMEFCAAKARERVQDAQGDRRSSCCQNRRDLTLWSVDPITRPLCEGLVADVHERNGAESLSQRYHFCSTLLHRIPQTLTIVHDDGWRLKLMRRDQRQSSTSDVACRLAQTNFIVDRFHAAAHTVRYCSQHCLPSLPRNEEIQADFPTDAAET
ncbi:unnamed protein product, partial [Durusdinium trenchii]